MSLQVPPIITKVEVEAALLPEQGESIEQLHDRAIAAGYQIVSIREDRIVILHTIEEN